MALLFHYNLIDDVRNKLSCCKLLVVDAIVNSIDLAKYVRYHYIESLVLIDKNVVSMALELIKNDGIANFSGAVETTNSMSVNINVKLSMSSIVKYILHSPLNEQIRRGAIIYLDDEIADEDVKIHCMSLLCSEQYSVCTADLAILRGKNRDGK